MASPSPAPSVGDREIVTVRVIDAPRQKVWDAWTIPEQWTQWWGPDGFTHTIKVMEVRSGGRWDFTMHGPDGTDYRNDGRYLQVVAPELIEWIHESTPKFRATATFEEVGARTRVTLRSSFESAADFERAVQVFHAVEGARQTLDRLAALVALPPALKELHFTRVVKASPEASWKAWTTAAALKQWFAPDGFTIPECTVDLRPGGALTLTMVAPDGQAYPTVGEFVEVRPRERLVFLDWLNGADGRPMMVERAEVLFQPAGRGTRITVHVRVIEMTAEAEFAVNGMDTGWAQTLDHLVTYLQG